MRVIELSTVVQDLPRLVEEVRQGQPFLIAIDGKPVARVEGVLSPTQRRVGFLEGEIVVPEDFDRMGAAEIESSMLGDG